MKLPRALLCGLVLVSLGLTACGGGNSPAAVVTVTQTASAGGSAAGTPSGGAVADPAAAASDAAKAEASTSAAAVAASAKASASAAAAKTKAADAKAVGEVCALLKQYPPQLNVSDVKMSSSGDASRAVCMWEYKLNGGGTTGIQEGLTGFIALVRVPGTMESLDDKYVKEGLQPSGKPIRATMDQLATPDLIDVNQAAMRGKWAYVWQAKDGFSYAFVMKGMPVRGEYSDPSEYRDQTAADLYDKTNG